MLFESSSQRHRLKYPAPSRRVKHRPKVISRVKLSVALALVGARHVGPLFHDFVTQVVDRLHTKLM